MGGKGGSAGAGGEGPLRPDARASGGSSCLLSPAAHCSWGGIKPSRSCGLVLLQGAREGPKLLVARAKGQRDWPVQLPACPRAHAQHTRGI